MTNPQPTRRLRLHRSTWVVGMVVLFLGTMVVFPGSGIFFSPSEYVLAPRWTPTVFQHGWPWPFLTRNGFSRNAPILEIPWLSLDAWKFWETSWDREFSPWYLVLDILVLAVVAGSIPAVWEWRRRRRKRLLQFNLADLLVISTLIASPLGWYVYQRNEMNREQALIATLEEQYDGAFNARPVETVKLGWLKRLAGQRLVPQFYFVTHLDYYSELSDQPEVFESALPILEDFKHLQSLFIACPLVDDENLIDAIGKLASVDILTVYCEIESSPAELEFIKDISRLQQLSELEIRLKSPLPEDLRQRLREQLPNSTIKFVEED